MGSPALIGGEGGGFRNPHPFFQHLGITSHHAQHACHGKPFLVTRKQIVQQMTKLVKERSTSLCSAELPGRFCARAETGTCRPVTPVRRSSVRHAGAYSAVVVRKAANERAVFKRFRLHLVVPGRGFPGFDFTPNKSCSEPKMPSRTLSYWKYSRTSRAPAVILAPHKGSLHDSLPAQNCRPRDECCRRAMRNACSFSTGSFNASLTDRKAWAFPGAHHL